MTDETKTATNAEDENEGRVGIFPSWRAAYVTVLIYTAVITVLLYLMTRALDYSIG